MKNIFLVLILTMIFLNGYIYSLSQDVLIENTSYREVIDHVIQVNFVSLMNKLKLNIKQKRKIIRGIEKAEISRNKFFNILKKEKNKIIYEFDKLRDKTIDKKKLTDQDKNKFNKKMDSIGLAMEDSKIEINNIIKDIWKILNEDQKKIILGYQPDILAFLEENPNIWKGKTTLNSEDQNLMDKIETIFLRKEIKEILKKTIK